MNGLQVLQHTDGESPEKREALELHFRLKADIEIAGNAIVDFTESLKTMRDKKLFVELGYDSFGAYTKKEHNIEERQAYNYITSYEKLGKSFLQSNANLGITKLQLLAAADWSERERIMENNAVEDMSVSELKSALDEVANLKKQLTFLQENPVTVETQSAPADTEALKEEIRMQLENEYKAQLNEVEQSYATLEATYDQRITDLESQVMTDDELAKYKANAEKEAKAAAAEEQKKLKADLKAALDASDKKDAIAKKDAKAIADAEERVKAAEEKTKKAEEDLKRVAELEAKIATAEAEKQAVEKQIKLSADPEWTRFKFLMEAWESATAAVAEQLCKIDDGKQSKMKDRIKAVIGGLGI